MALRTDSGNKSTAESDEPMQIDPIVEGIVTKGLVIEGLTRQRVSSLCTILVKDS